MPLDRQARRFLDLLAAGARPNGAPGDLSDLRRAGEAIAAFAQAPPNVSRADFLLPGYEPVLPVRSYWPLDLAPKPAPGLVYFHGGGWISSSIDSHDAIAARLAQEGRCRVLSVGYRLAPEHRFPAALDDCRAAIAVVSADPERFQIDPARLGVAGDSVGANLAVASLVQLGGAAARLALQVLLCPVMEALGRSPSRLALAAGHLIDEATLQAFWDYYRVPGLAPDDPRVSPLRSKDFSHLPPAQIHSAEFDPLVDEAALYSEALRQAGVEARLTCHAGLIHHFYGLTRVIPAAEAAWRVIGAELRAAFV